MLDSVPSSTADVTGNVPVPLAIASGIDPLVAAYHTAHDFKGGVPALAGLMLMSPNTLAHKVSLNKDTHHLTLRESVVMQEMACDYRILHAMGGALGHVCISMQLGGVSGSMQDAARMAREFSEAFTAFTESAADGLVTPNEMLHCERQAAELQAAINAALGTLRGMMPASREVRA